MGWGLDMNELLGGNRARKLPKGPLAYVALAIVVWRRQHWSTTVGVVALLASIPPYGSVVFERWATRTGRLVESDTPLTAQ